jgi:hypothetical protein
MRRLYWAPALGLALLACVGRLAGAPRVEAEPDRDYPVNAEAGEWMILAGTFTGDCGPELAKQLANQIRKNHKLNAYVFDYSDPERLRWREQLQQAQIPGVKDPDLIRSVRVERSFAVLVGGYKDIDAAHAALLSFKKLPAPDLQARDGVMPYPTATYGDDAGNGLGKARIVKINPFAIAYVVRNPTAPKVDKKVEAQNDHFLIQLNEGEEFSLLKNEHPFTLAIKEYGCSAAIKQQEAEAGLFEKMLGFGKSKGESLGVAAANAHELAGALRKMHFDAYVLHTRRSSVVAVGGFEGKDDPNLAVVSRDLQKIQKQLASARKPDQPDPVGLLAAPVLIPVPRPK